MSSKAFENSIAGCGVVGGTYARLFCFMCGIRSGPGCLKVSQTNISFVRVFEGTCPTFSQVCLVSVQAWDLSHLITVISYHAAEKDPNSTDQWPVDCKAKFKTKSHTAAGR